MLITYDTYMPSNMVVFPDYVYEEAPAVQPMETVILLVGSASPGASIPAQADPTN